jgi:DNA-binding transcriptional LysR family regulator
MNLKNLRQFVAVAEAGSFRRAAERIGVEQPVVTVGIQKLEAELGQALFIRGRGNGGTELTAAGAAILESARLALMHVDNIQPMLDELKDGTQGTLRVSFVGSATYAFLPRVIPGFRQSFPGVSLVMTETTSIAMLQDLQADKLDVGLVRGPLLSRLPEGVELVKVEEDEIMLAVASASEFAKLSAVALAEMASQPFIMYSASNVPHFNSIATLLCQQAGFVPKIAQEVNKVATLLSLVASGLGVGLVPGITGGYTSELVRLIPLKDQSETKHVALYMAHRGSRSTIAAKRFVDHVMSRL